MLDIHSHILPYVDDGSDSMDITHAMLRAAKAAGIHFIIATPHFRKQDMDREHTQLVFSEVKRVAYGYGIQMRLGFEVHYSMLTHIETDTIQDWCIQGTRSILLEFSNSTRPAHWDIMVCDLVRNGYSPIIVHPERYTYIQESIDMAVELKRYGCEIQLDAMAFKNRFDIGNSEMKTAKKLLDAGLIDYIASDAHRPEDYRILSKVRKRLGSQWLEKGGLFNKFRL